MKKTVLFLLAAAMVIMCGCEKLSITNYIGTVVEGNSKTPIPDVKVSFTNGSDVYCSTVTNDKGECDLTVNFTEVTDDYYFLFEGAPDLPVRTLMMAGLTSLDGARAAMTMVPTAISHGVQAGQIPIIWHTEATIIYLI